MIKKYHSKINLAAVTQYFTESELEELLKSLWTPFKDRMQGDHRGAYCSDMDLRGHRAELVWQKLE